MLSIKYKLSSTVENVTETSDKDFSKDLKYRGSRTLWAKKTACAKVIRQEKCHSSEKLKESKHGWNEGNSDKKKVKKPENGGSWSTCYGFGASS